MNRLFLYAFVLLYFLTSLNLGSLKAARRPARRIVNEVIEMHKVPDLDSSALGLNLEISELQDIINLKLRSQLGL